MERKIGEIFEYKGEWYQRVGSDMYDYCKGCPSFKDLRCTTLYGYNDCWLKATCKKLENVGEPVKINGVLMQKMKTPIAIGCEQCVLNNNGCSIAYEKCFSNELYVIKQNQEDMSNTENHASGYSQEEIDKMVYNIGQNQEDMEEKKDVVLSNLEMTGKNLNNYIVYKHISPNGKEYVGMTRNIKRRWEGNGCSYKKNSEFRNDIMKYGWDNFQHIIVKDNLSIDEASKLEDELIVDAKSRGVAYNISRGGIGGAHPAWNKGIPLSKEQIEKLRAANLGKIMGEETRRKIGESSRGHIVSDETKRKIGDKNRGKKHGKEHTSKWIKSNMWRFRKVEIRKDGVFIGTYESIREAARSIGKSRGFIDGIIQRPKGKHQGYTVIILD